MRDRELPPHGVASASVSCRASRSLVRVFSSTDARYTPHSLIVFLDCSEGFQPLTPESVPQAALVVSAAGVFVSAYTLYRAVAFTEEMMTAQDDLHDKRMKAKDDREDKRTEAQDDREDRRLLVALALTAVFVTFILTKA